jgi:hypothetical protein
MPLSEVVSIGAAVPEQTDVAKENVGVTTEFTVRMSVATESQPAAFTNVAE